MNNLGKILKHIRVFNHCTQEETAKKVNITRGHLSLIENGHKEPLIPVLESYSKSFDIPLSAIMLFAEDYSEKVEFSEGIDKLRNKLKKSTTNNAIKFLDWICKKEEK